MHIVIFLVVNAVYAVFAFLNIRILKTLSLHFRKLHLVLSANKAILYIPLLVTKIKA